MEKKLKNYFVTGAITSDFIASAIVKHQAKTDIGAHQIFLGQIRADDIDGNIVESIEYTAFVEMANKVFEKIRESVFSKFNVVCIHIYHSIGTVKAGEISLFVFVSSKHRKDAVRAIEYIVEEIKSKTPVFGKEIFQNNDYQWKINS